MELNQALTFMKNYPGVKITLHIQSLPRLFHYQYLDIRPLVLGDHSNMLQLDPGSIFHCRYEVELVNLVLNIFEPPYVKKKGCAIHTTFNIRFLIRTHTY